MKNILMAFGLGAGVMYLSDPRSRARRRAVLRDKMLHHLSRGIRTGDVVARDMAHRTQGVVAEFSRVFSQLPVDDDILVAQVRSRLGRLVSNPHNIEVHAKQGRVTLMGLCRNDEMSRVVRTIARMKNVRGVVNQLVGHRQGARKARIPQPIDIFNKSWSPATRFLTTIGAGSMALFGMRRGGLRGVVISALGLMLGVRAVTNREVRELLSAAPLRRGLQPGFEIEVAKPRALEPVATMKPKAA